ncbi:hypothetical protein AYO21_05149 [Fonsecaea monophora]|uniref:Cysteine-rich transmembrane CYSTM domain-containing protein n=2 Tax=Fonsecaea TaxID=40354 RepID=A0A0D2GZB3_9EURO|nr:uncharacterized protein Z517_03186 [Fonsecaea pedrosoi CBS 271.37]XP_022512605.1 hypothetical protein AYO21_05149 [Fonsecaea monophora]KAH0832466.1 hypothetical protein FOPE_01256 [Fonsecaea pedrosoi]KIW83940.1 hypothetical protein Z517_03186 [Fonsecaea pedrosoi CBS 271.37]OAG40653.1 hypothetical protein AYO21_05149 [Fonsecaea monophora]
MADKFDPPAYPPPAQYAAPNHSQTGFQSPPPQMAYDPNYQQQQMYDPNHGANQGYYGGGPPPQGYYGGPGYGPPQGWNGQQPPPQVVYERDRGSSGPGICTGLLAGLACCCCLDALF